MREQLSEKERHVEAIKDAEKAYLRRKQENEATEERVKEVMADLTVE